MLKKIALFSLVVVAIVMLSNMVVALAPNWQHNVRTALTLFM